MRGAAKFIWIFLFVAFVGGFLFADLSGLVGMTGVSASTTVGSVNGKKISYLAWENLTRSLVQQQEQQAGQSITADERLQLEQQAFDQIVADILLQQEYERRGIRVTDDEIVNAARFSPPPQFYSAPELQTDGRFDPEKYQRFLASPVARQQGLLRQLEDYYRTEIPRTKLFAQVASETWVSDEMLWQTYRDERDSAEVSFVALRPTPAQVEAAQVSTADARRYYQQYAGRWDRPGRAVVSVVSISRVPTAADTARTVARLRELRAEITSGRSTFADVAQRESMDSVSAADGGNLGRGPRGRFVAPFETAAFALRAGQVSEPVRTDFGWHLIQVTDRKGDTLDLRHILLRVEQGDSAATATDRLADRLAGLAAGSMEPQKFDDAAQQLSLLVTQVPVVEGQSAVYQGRGVRGISGWAFTGVRPGEVGDLIDDENGYYLVRLDSLTEGGKQPFERVQEDIISALKERKAAEGLVAQGEALLADARATSLAAAVNKAGLSLESPAAFTRRNFVPGLGFANEAIGASFGAPLGTPVMVRTIDAVILLQANRRTTADREDFDLIKEILRQQQLPNARDARIRQYLEQLRQAAKIEDKRREVNATLRRQVIE
jgi:peptidyl-prolyl cis-trans isomerase D